MRAKKTPDGAVTSVIFHSLNSEENGGIFPLAKRLAEELGDRAGSAVNVNTYIKVTGSTALPPHPDKYDVFIIQYGGRGNWTVCPGKRGGESGIAGLHLNTDAGASLWRAHADGNSLGGMPVDLDRDVFECKTVILEENQAMFIPKDVVHSATAIGDELSMHFTMAVLGSQLAFRDAVDSLFDTFPGSKRKAELKEVSMKQQEEDVRLHLQVREGFDPAVFDAILDSLFKRHCGTFGPKHGLSCDDLDRKLYRFFDQQRRSESLQRNIAYGQKHPDRARARRQGFACCIGQPAAAFTCPGDPTEHEKRRSERGPDTGHDCDWVGTHCHHDDPNSCYYRCENRCEVCDCSRGSLLTGCTLGSQDTGACELNEAGAFCNEESGVEIFCRDGLTCAGGFCCDPEVALDHCTACEWRTGSCDAWEPGYVGPLARSCANGYYETRDSTCLPEGEGGNTCTENYQCASRSCKGGACCTEDAATAVRCSTCGSLGECTSCDAQGVASATNCATCNSGYYARTGGGHVACFPLELSGRSCSTAGQCRSNDCRRERCCAALSPFTVRTCTACDVDGSCDECRDGHTAAGVECYTNCINAAGDEVDHGGTDSRHRYATTAPTAGQRCADVLSVEQRSCANETWSSWGPVSSENIGQPFPHSECFDNCPIPGGLAGIGIRVCPLGPAAFGSDGELNSTSCRPHAGQWVAFESIVLQQRYAAPEVDTGELCTPVEAFLSCESTGELEAHQGDVEQAAPYFQCAPKCAPACRLVMERDGDDCHPGCNVAACHYQHGTCTLIAQRRSLAAHEMVMLRTERGIQQGTATFEELCGEEVLGSPAQQAVQDDACRVNRYVAAGRDPDGHGSNWVHSLTLTEYLDAADHLLQAMVVGEAEMRAAEADADRERQDSLLVGKIALLLQDVRGHFSALAVTDTAFRSELNVAMRSLTSSMQAQHVLVRQGLGRLLRGQAGISGQITRAVTSLRSDELVSTNAMQATAERNYRAMRDLVTRSNDVVLRGQQAILEEIAEQRGVIDELHEMALRQSANTNVQDQFTAVLSGYFASTERVGNQTQIATRVFAKFGPDQAGWDTDLDGLMSAEELYEMLKDLGLLNSYAELYMSLVFHHQALGTRMQAVDFAHLVMNQAGHSPPAVRWVTRETGLDGVDSDAADANGDGALDAGEALLVLANNYGLMGSGIDMVRNWARQAYGPRRRRSVASSVSWENFTACDGVRQIGVALREESSSIGVGPIAEMGNVMRAVMDGIGAIGVAFADAVGKCTNFLRTLFDVVLAVLTGGLSAIVLAVVAVVASAAECADAVNDLVNQVSSTFNDAIAGYALLVDMVENGLPHVVNWAASRATAGAINAGCGPLAAVVGSVAPTVDAARAATAGIRNAASRTVRLVERLDAQLRQVGTNATEPVRLSQLGLTGDAPALYVQSSADDIANVQAHLPGVLSEVRQVIQQRASASGRSPAACNAWIEAEIGNGSAWQRQIEAEFPCPCDEQHVLDASPNPWVAEDGFWRTATHFYRLSRYHPGADECYRAGPTTDGHGQQCCYRNGRLLTTGAGAGTMDKAHAGNRDAHVEIDVVPFGWCGEAGGWRTYTRARPTSNIASCTTFERRRSLHEDQSNGTTTGRGNVSFRSNVQEDALVVQMVVGMARTNNNIAESATAIASRESVIEVANRYQEELANRSNDTVPFDRPAQNAAVILEQQLNNMRRRMLSYIWRCILNLGATTHEDEAVQFQGTTAAEFGRVLNTIRHRLLTWRESSVARTRTQMTVVLTVFCNEHPAECAKLTDPTGSAVVSLFVRPPNASDFCETAVIGVKARFLPTSVADRVVHVAMAKDGCSGSTYFRRGGNLRTAVRYQHETRTFDDHYFADGCRPASDQTTPEGTFRVSPYGVWHLWTRSLFERPVQQIRLEFQLETSMCPSDDRTSPSRPMFADDLVAPNGVDVMHPNDSRCDMAALHPDVSCNGEADPDRCAQFSAHDCLDISAANVTCPVLCGACTPVTSTVAPTISPTRCAEIYDNDNFTDRHPLVDCVFGYHQQQCATDPVFYGNCRFTCTGCTQAPTSFPTTSPSNAPSTSPSTTPTGCDYGVRNSWDKSECQQAYNAGQCLLQRPLRHGWGAGTWFAVCEFTCHGCTESPTASPTLSPTVSPTRFPTACTQIYNNSDFTDIRPLADCADGFRSGWCNAESSHPQALFRQHCMFTCTGCPEPAVEQQAEDTSLGDGETAGVIVATLFVMAIILMMVVHKCKSESQSNVRPGVENPAYDVDTSANDEFGTVISGVLEYDSSLA